MMRKILLGFALVSVFCFAAYLRYHHAKPPLGVAYAGNHQVTLWSTTAQVREPVVTVNYGDRLDVLQRFEEEVKVRTASGFTGWVSEKELLPEDLWEKAKELNARAAALPVEARGHTRVLSNLHIEPGRDTPRLRQLNKQVPVDLFERDVEEVPTTARATGEEDDSGAETATAKKEDWWLVLAHAPGDAPVAGWMLGRFIDLDVPQPLPDYASSTDMRIVAWFELNHVTDASGTSKPQYLVVGTRGSEGQPCDFTMLRVYTWGTQRQRYETAFVDSKACGKLPVKLTAASAAGGDATFSFEDSSQGSPEERAYRMHQTIVRRVKNEGAASSGRKAR